MKKTTSKCTTKMQPSKDEMEDMVTNLELSEPPLKITNAKDAKDICKKQEEESINVHPKQTSEEDKFKTLQNFFHHRNTVPVKKNAATILREASRVINEEEKEIQRLNDLVNGGMDLKRYEQLEEEFRAMAEAVELQEIQKKHLLGLLSREEAIIAKHRLQQANKAKRAQIEKEKKEAEEILKIITLEHNEKIKNIVAKTQQIQKNIVEQKKNILDKKQKEAQEVAEINKQLYENCILKRREELEEKIQIIKQIKELSNIKDLNENEFDPTETMNMGLLCEMSLNELQERLLLNKARLKEEIENRKKYIIEQKIKQQQFLLDTQKFIDDCRKQRKNMNLAERRNIRLSKTIENQDITYLQERLQAARLTRKQFEHVEN